MKKAVWVLCSVFLLIACSEAQFSITPQPTLTRGDSVTDDPADQGNPDNSEPPQTPNEPPIDVPDPAPPTPPCACMEDFSSSSSSSSENNSTSSSEGDKSGDVSADLSNDGGNSCTPVGVCELTESGEEIITKKPEVVQWVNGSTARDACMTERACLETINDYLKKIGKIDRTCDVCTSDSCREKREKDEEYKSYSGKPKTFHVRFVPKASCSTDPNAQILNEKMLKKLLK